MRNKVKALIFGQAIGAVAGVLLGLKFGLNSIPKHQIDNLVGKDTLIYKINAFLI